MPTLYLDACCLNRPFDDQAQERVRLESEAVLLILSRVEAGVWRWIGSEALIFEVDRTPDPDRRARVRLLIAAVSHTMEIGEAEVARAEQLEMIGIHALDALHLACAEAGPRRSS